MMRPDHYATLGVAANASAAEIRAAYLKLMRVHHPDRNPSPESAERARAIIAAFKVLSDFDQRSHYDWDRRRDRERASALAAAPDRTLDKKAVVVGAAGAGIVLAAIAGWSMIVPTADRPTPDHPVGRASAERTPPPVTTPPPAPELPPLAAEQREAIIRMRPVLPRAEVAERVFPKDPPKTVAKPPAIRPEVRVAAVPPAPRPRTKVVEPPPVRVAAKQPPPVRVAATSFPRPQATRPATDIASLDQFVMNFYGQSWRYGDAPKRAVLEQTRASFVARRGACTGDTCRRNAYLDLMRDVSSIVETGKPEPR